MFNFEDGPFSLIAALQIFGFGFPCPSPPFKTHPPPLTGLRGADAAASLGHQPAASRRRTLCVEAQPFPRVSPPRRPYRCPWPPDGPASPRSPRSMLPPAILFGFCLRFLLPPAERGPSTCAALSARSAIPARRARCVGRAEGRRRRRGMAAAAGRPLPRAEAAAGHPERVCPPWSRALGSLRGGCARPTPLPRCRPPRRICAFPTLWRRWGPRCALAPTHRASANRCSVVGRSRFYNWL